MKYKLVSDDSGHDYVIPSDKSKEWYDFLEIPDDDPRSWDVPDWAIGIGGELEFENPTDSGRLLIFPGSNLYSGGIIHDGLMNQ